jgi:hypothetical protein
MSWRTLLLPIRSESPPESSPAPEPVFTPAFPPAAPASTPSKSRKMIIAIVLIVVIAGGIAFGFVYSQTGLFRSQAASQPAAGYNMYSNYGFSFQYLKTWTITERGLQNNVADANSGIVSAQAPNGQQDFVFVAWTRSVYYVNGSSVLPSAVNGFQSGSHGSGLAMGQESTATTRAGYRVYLLPFSVTVSGTQISGVWSAWYSTQGQRLYQLSSIASGNSASSMYDTSLASFVEL